MPENRPQRSRQRFVVRFDPSGLRCSCPEGMTVLGAAQKAGVTIPSVCGGAGLCGKCKIKVTQGVTPITDVEREWLTPRELREGIRLACQTRIIGEAVVQVVAPAEEGQVLETGIHRQVYVRPAVRKRYVELPRPTLEGNPFDWEDLCAQVADCKDSRPYDVNIWGVLPSRLRKWDFRGTAVTLNGRLLDFERGNTRACLYGVAVDLGTTTVVGKLIDLVDGSVQAVASSANPQRIYGEDVVSRVQHASKGKRERRELQKAAVHAINGIVERLLAEARVPRRFVYELVVDGNTVMNHLLIGADPTYMAEYPYVPVFRGPIDHGARQLGIRIHRNGRVHVLPAIGRFVGGDTTGVLLATDLCQRDTLHLAVDIGTNGEMVLGHKGWAVACSTAAGPAFEGANIRHGMRAEKGAIDSVWVEDGRLRMHVIGEVEARGICGSAVIDVVAELLRLGIVQETGRMLPPDQLSREIPPELRERVRTGDDGVFFVLTERGGEPEVVFTQRDVREVQLAKGAIATGIEMLLSEAGKDLSDVDRVLVAGGFGNYMKPENALRIGLLPQMPREKVHYVGNAALTGAEMALISVEARREARRIAERVRYIEIAARPEFQERFAENMLFPSGDAA